jgi:phosphotriesterase-related protein
MSVVRTVLGDIDSSDLGLVLPHEHLANDASRAYQPPADHSLAGVLAQKVSSSNAWALRERPYHNADNCVLDDDDAMVADLKTFAAFGGRTVIDLTPPGLGRAPQRLRQLSTASGMQVIMGSGWYLEPYHPDHLGGSSVEELAEELVEDFAPHNTVRPGVIGEIGVSPAFTAAEEKALRAAALAQREIAVPLFVHLPGWKRFGGRVLDIVLDDLGVDPPSVVLCHMDPSGNDFQYQRALADRGVCLEFDMVGMPFLFPGEGQSPAPQATAEAIARLVEAGRSSQLLLSHDLFLKAMLSSNGGNGLSYIPVLFADRLVKAGVPAPVVDSLLTENPRSLFDTAASRKG